MKQKKETAPGSNGHSNPRIRLEFAHPTAIAVSVASSFNDWRPEATPMVSLGEGRWIKELELPAGTYEYRFVVDGKWMCDSLAKETAPNPFGSANSVLRVPNESKSIVSIPHRIAIPL